MNELLQSRPLPTKATKRYFQAAPSRLYAAREIYVLLKIGRRTFYDWKKAGKLPLVEVRIGRTVRYHAAPIDRLLSDRHGR